MEHCRLPDGVTSISVRPYYTMLSRVYLSLAMGFLVHNCGSDNLPSYSPNNRYCSDVVCWKGGNFTPFRCAMIAVRSVKHVMF